MPGSRGTPVPRTGLRRAGRSASAGVAVGLLCAAAVGPAAIAAETPPAEPRPADASAREVAGAQGQRLWVSRTAGLGAAETLVVRGSGFDVNKGIYVAFCVDPGPGQLPTPCGGGADTSGTGGASQWISSNPPSYGTELAKAYGPGGTFEVHVAVTPTIGVEGAVGGAQDCTKVTCSVLTRADHTRTGDRSQDVRVPVTFATDTADASDSDSASDSGGAALWWGGGIAAAVLVAGGWLVARKRGQRKQTDAASGTAAEPRGAAASEAGS